MPWKTLCCPKTLCRLMTLLCRLETLRCTRSGLNHALHLARADEVPALGLSMWPVVMHSASACAGHLGVKLYLIVTDTAAALSLWVLLSLLTYL